MAQLCPAAMSGRMGTRWRLFDLLLLGLLRKDTTAQSPSIIKCNQHARYIIIIAMSLLPAIKVKATHFLHLSTLAVRFCSSSRE